GYQLPPSPLDGSDVLSTQAKYHKNDWLLVHRAEANAVKSWAELANKKVLVMPRIELHPAYQQLLQTHRKVLFHTTSESDEEAVIAALSLGEFDYALVDENLFQLTQHIFYDIGKSFTVLTQQRAWLTSNRQAGLRFAIDRFFDQHLSKTELAALVEKHFAHTQKIKMFDLAVFETRITERLPKWKPFFQQAQQQHQIDWRLFAALAYQESQWDEKAVSGTNVQGIMQLTEDTARRYQVDRNNPTEAIAAGARYYADLYQKTPARIPEPDRSWFALAAYNLGLGHIEDARLLCAQARRNPDSWAEGKKMLPQLAVPHVAAKTKHGLARGGMAVEFVDNIRAYYELLQRLEPH
ncbi:MAG: rane-bound lytic murein transglycosylase MltF, partial [Pseudomonadota bacterium]